MFGDRKPIHFCSRTREGKIRARLGDEVKDHDYVEGQWAGIRLATRDMGQYGLVEKLEIDLEDGGEQIRFSAGSQTGTARGLVLSLAGAERTGRLRIDAFQVEHGGKTYTNAKARLDGKPLIWAEPMAPASNSAAGSDPRHEQTARLVKQIQTKLFGGTQPAATVEALQDSTEEDIPF